MLIVIGISHVELYNARQAILATEFGRQPLIIPNGIDCHRFTPGPRTQLPPTTTLLCTPGAAQVRSNSVLTDFDKSHMTGCHRGQDVGLLVGNSAPL
jgi:hypothetical protein